jgi:hypothetical protein
MFFYLSVEMQQSFAAKVTITVNQTSIELLISSEQKKQKYYD